MMRRLVAAGFSTGVIYKILAPVGCAGRGAGRAGESGRGCPRRLETRPDLQNQIEVEARALPPLAQKQVRAKNGAPSGFGRIGYRNAASGPGRASRDEARDSQLLRGCSLGARKRRTRLGRRLSNGFLDRPRAWADRPAPALSFHSAVHPGEDMGAGGAIADGERLIQRPFVIDGAALGDDGAESVLEALAVLGFAADGDVGHQAEQGAAPVGATPGVGMIEPWSPSAGSPLGMPCTMSRHTWRASSSPVSTRAMGST